MTINAVDMRIACHPPPNNESRIIGRVSFTITFESNNVTNTQCFPRSSNLNTRRAFFRSSSVPLSTMTCRFVWSSPIRPNVRPNRMSQLNIRHDPIFHFHREGIPFYVPHLQTHHPEEQVLGLRQSEAKNLLSKDRPCYQHCQKWELRMAEGKPVLIARISKMKTRFLTEMSWTLRQRSERKENEAKVRYAGDKRISSSCRFGFVSHMDHFALQWHAHTLVIFFSVMKVYMYT